MPPGHRNGCGRCGHRGSDRRGGGIPRQGAAEHRHKARPTAELPPSLSTGSGRLGPCRQGLSRRYVWKFLPDPSWDTPLPISGYCERSSPPVPRLENAVENLTAPRARGSAFYRPCVLLEDDVASGLCCWTPVVDPWVDSIWIQTGLRGPAGVHLETSNSARLIKGLRGPGSGLDSGWLPKKIALTLANPGAGPTSIASPPRKDPSRGVAINPVFSCLRWLLLLPVTSNSHLMQETISQAQAIVIA